MPRSLIFCCSLVLVLLENAYSDPITFRQAIELAARQGVLKVRSTQMKTLAAPESFDAAVDYAAELPNSLNSNADAAEWKSPVSPVGERAALSAITNCNFQATKQEDQHSYAVLDAAITYSKLNWVNLHLQASKEQHDSAVRLASAEKVRVVVGVDDEISLIRARLLEAETRQLNANLEREELALRKHLGYLIGTSGGGFEPIFDSIPPVSKKETLKHAEKYPLSYCELELEMRIREQIASRDAAQLTYLIAERDALRKAGSTATLREELTSQIGADEKFGVLLDATFALLESQLELLSARGELERWATTQAPGKPGLTPMQSTVGPYGEASSFANTLLTAEQVAENVPHPNSSLRGTTIPTSVQTILVLPSNGVLSVRKCRQLAAIAVGAGGGKDVTSAADWFSSNESVAIVSTSGLVTGLRSGSVTITASLGGILHSKSIQIE
jgi:hypothetical protein